MKKSTVIAFSAAVSLLMTGCVSPKKDVVAKDYVLIVHNVSYWGCSNIGMSVFKTKYGLEKREVLYHEDVDNTANCDDYEHEKEKTCWEESLSGNGSGVGDHVCAIGIDEVDEPDTANEAEVKKQKFVAIIPHVSSLACTKGGIDKVLEDHDYGGTQYEFTQENADVSCAKFPGTTCQTLVGPEEEEAGYSKKLSCVIGTQDKPLKNK